MSRVRYVVSFSSKLTERLNGVATFEGISTLVGDNFNSVEAETGLLLLANEKLTRKPGARK
jgi:hypothetical protein